MSINKVILIGRLGQDPDLKHTPSGMTVCNFSLATSDSWTDKNGQKQERTEWHRVVVWGKLAELCGQYLSKGKQAYLEGSLQTRSWEQDGQKKYTTEIVAKAVQFLGSGNSTDNKGTKNQAPAQDGDQSYDITSDASFTADDIPF